MPGFLTTAVEVSKPARVTQKNSGAHNRQHKGRPGHGADRKSKNDFRTKDRRPAPDRRGKKLEPDNGLLGGVGEE